MSPQLRAEHLLAAILSSTEDAVLSFGLDGAVQSWSPGAQRLYGYCESEIVGQPLARLLPIADTPSFDGLIRAAISGNFPHHETSPRLHKDGSRILVRLTHTPVRDDHGHIIAIVENGASVASKSIESTGEAHLKLLIDQMPMITSNPGWSPQELEDAGAIFDGKSLFDNVNALAGPDGVKTTEGFIRGMFTKQYPVDAVNWVIQENLKFPREYAARLLFDHATNDWRDLIPAINIPTLVVGGKASLVPWKSQVWIGKQIKGAKTEIFEENEGGAHFMFMENPEKFNRLVNEFNG